MGKIKDRVGERFGKLTVVELAYVKRQAFWECLCTCGNTTIVMGNNLKKTKSCGCHRVENLKQLSTKHGFGNTRVSHIYNSMKQRCCNPKSKDYFRYGGRGILMHKEWQDSPETFYDWAMDNGYEETLTIERIDVNGNYEPLNCAWVTQKEQANNRRNNRLITIGDQTKTLQQWLDEIDMPESTLLYRMKQGLTLEEAVKHNKNKHIR